MQPPPLVSKRPTVLVVDDVQGVREMLKATLKACCRVIEASTNEQALELAGHHDVDVAISDLSRCPGENGFQFLKAFKETHPDTPVIIFSATVTGARERRAYRLGAFRCVSKPGMADEILKLVCEAVESRRI